MKRESGLTHDMTAERIAALKEIFPDVFKDGKIDFDALSAELGEYAENPKEKYCFSWAGKQDALRLAQKRSTGTLLPCREESKNWDTTQNLYIEGDNLEVLKLLQSAYLGRVKMIYIDPPYNTGNDFVYKDDFADSIANYREVIGEATKSNAETAGRYHTNWLNMIYPRLKLARTFLRDDGVIFISIDDNEQANLKKLCDEVFGEENFVAQVVWERAYAPINLMKHFSPSHDYILCYAKSIDNLVCNGIKRTQEANDRYSNPDNDPRGVWKSSDMSVGPAVQSNIYTIQTPSGRLVEPPAGRSWRLSKNAFFERLKDNRIVFGDDGNGVPRIKRFLNELRKEGMTPMTIWKYTEVGHSQDATKDLKKTFDDNLIFNYPKPVELIKRCLQLYTQNDDIVLDFFSGSATTAHAVMQLNAEDGGNRRFILVQLPELMTEDSEAKKIGYKNICEIGKERIRRAGDKIIANSEGKSAVESGQSIDDSEQLSVFSYQKGDKNNANNVSQNCQLFTVHCQLDTGFKVFKLDSSNFKKWNNAYTRDYKELQNRFRENLDYLTPGRTALDMAYELLLKFGQEPTNPMEELLVPSCQLSEGSGQLSVVSCQNEDENNSVNCKLKEDSGQLSVVSCQNKDIVNSENCKLKTENYVTAYVYTHPADGRNGEYKLLFCMQEDLTIEQTEALAALKVGTYFFADRCFADVNGMQNADEILKKLGKEMRLF
jgi:adenine-specific DNA-methyltransferase